MKRLFLAILMPIFLTFPFNEASASALENSQSAKLSSSFEVKKEDNRVTTLRKYLEQYNSPLASSAGTFIETADQYSLDWRLVASIAGLESGFGHHIPHNSYNGWGWGVYGDNVIRFASWDEGIITISKGLRERYLKDLTESDPYIIGPIYAASPTWAQRVSFFMNQIKRFEVAQSHSELSISL